MDNYIRYRRTQVAHLRPVTDQDVLQFDNTGSLLETTPSGELVNVSISTEDLTAGPPLIGDMIARNPSNHNDVWLVAEEYFKNNFEEIK